MTWHFVASWIQIADCAEQPSWSNLMYLLSGILQFLIVDSIACFEPTQTIRRGPIHAVFKVAETGACSSCRNFMAID